MSKQNQAQTNIIGESNQVQSQFIKIWFCADTIEFSEKTNNSWLKGRLEGEDTIARKVINVWGLPLTTMKAIVEHCQDNPFDLVEVLGFFDQKEVTLMSGSEGNTLYSLNNAKVRKVNGELVTKTLEVENVPEFKPRALNATELKKVQSRRQSFITVDDTRTEFTNSVVESEATTTEKANTMANA